MKTRLSRALFLIGAAASFVSAQTGNWDTTGNALLNGQTYYFRHVLWAQNGDAAGDLTEAIAAYGTIAFSGGTYTITGQIFDLANNSSTPVAFTGITGSYSIAASGFGFMDSPLNSGDQVYGLVGKNGVFIGSSTENASLYNDLFIAAPIGTTQATASTFNGNYTIMDLDDPGIGLQGAYAYAQNVMMTVPAQGNGSLGSIALSGFIAGNGTSPIRQTIGGVKYSFSNGAGNINFPTSNTNLISGSRFMYITPDGSFVFGGSPTGFDMFVGVRTGSGTPNFSGLYYQAGMDVGLGYLSSAGYTDLDGYFGSFKASSGTILGHQRFADEANGGPYDFNYSDFYTFNSDGSVDDAYLEQHFVFSSDGSIRIGFGNLAAPVNGSNIGVSVSLLAPTFSGSGVNLDPTGITNTASSALFTSSIAPGELLTLYGTSGSTLASGSAQNGNFPSTLAGVQVNINSIAAPILAVNECGPYPCVTVMVPYEIQGPYVQIQLTSGSKVSNTIVGFYGASAPGLFTIPAGGLGHAAAEHAPPSYAVVTTSNPANIGETISAYLTGLGAVSPAVADGAPGTAYPPGSTAVESFQVYVGSGLATVGFAGLAPVYAGLGQLNFQMPSGVTAGDQYLDIITCPGDCNTTSYDSLTDEALLSVSGTSVSAARPAAVVPVRKMLREKRSPLEHDAVRPNARRSLPATSSSTAPRLVSGK
jgi:uncharacterized protein (TIGR03437 family)